MSAAHGEEVVGAEMHARIAVRVDAYLGEGMSTGEAWRKVREENDALLASGTGF